MSLPLREIDVVILCGGRGQRLRPITHDRPKAMCEFNKQPFLSILMGYVARYGFRRFILCVGYKRGVIKSFYRTQTCPWEILYSEEERPLGTGGALRRAQRFISSDVFLAMNGDSFCPMDLGRFVLFHQGRDALLSVALCRDRQHQDSGRVVLDKNQRIISFKEKGLSSDTGFINTGIYLMNTGIFSFMKQRRRFSLEYDLFPLLLKEKCYGFRQKADVVDFGIPVGYIKAQRFLKEVE